MDTVTCISVLELTCSGLWTNLTNYESTLHNIASKWEEHWKALKKIARLIKVEHVLAINPCKMVMIKIILKTEILNNNRKQNGWQCHNMVTSEYWK